MKQRFPVAVMGQAWTMEAYHMTIANCILKLGFRTFWKRANQMEICGWDQLDQAVIYLYLEFSKKKKTHIFLKVPFDTKQLAYVVFNIHISNFILKIFHKAVWNSFYGWSNDVSKTRGFSLQQMVSNHKGLCYKPKPDFKPSNLHISKSSFQSPPLCLI